jgi:hypothetical protein
MHLTRVLFHALLVAASLSPLGFGQQALPEPPKPPRGARVDPSPIPEPVVPGTPAPPLEGVPLGKLSYGSIVSGPVALYPHVRVKDADDAAPGGASVIVAVRDPNAGRRSPAGIVFVKICVPLCPLEKIKCNKWGTEIELDYDDYEIEIESCDGVVTIDYDD